MEKHEIAALLHGHLSGVRAALNAHLDGIDRALATHFNVQGQSVGDRLATIETRLEDLEAGR